MATSYSAIRDSAPQVAPSSRKFPIYRRWWWQFEALTFKNGALFVRKWGAAAIFVLAPTLFILFLWLLHQSVVSGGSSSSAAGHAHFGKCKTYNVYWEEADFPCTTLAYAPVGGRYDDIMRRVATKTELRFGEDVVGYPSMEALLLATASNPSRRIVNSAVLFNTSISLDLPVTESALRYYIFYNGSVHDTSTEDGYPYTSSSPDPEYWEYSAAPIPTGYFALQAHVESSILEVLAASPEGSVQLSFSRSRFESLLSDTSGSGAVVKIAGPAFLICGATVSVLVVYTLVAREKQQRLLHTMKMMGLMEGAYWTSWMVPLLVASGLSAVMAIGVSKLSDILLFKLTDFSVHAVAMWLFLVAFSSAMLFFGSFTHKPRTVNILSFVFFVFAALTGFMCSLFGFYDLVYSPGSNFFVHALVLFWPFFHYGRVVDTILKRTQWVGPNTTPQPFHWSDLSNATSTHPGQGVVASWDAPSAGYSLWMLALNAAVYFALAWYVGQMAANGEATALPFWFPLDPVYWGLARRHVSYMQGDTVAELREESVREGSVRLHNLSKAFKTTTAVKEVSLSMPRGQLVALLGHNGAGKTTLVNMLSGVLAPTHGEAFVFGYSVRSDMQDIQSMMGSCPQHDTLWDHLTCAEHLRLFSRFKCIPDAAIDAHVDAQLALVKLEGSRDARANTLSGGMQRRLSVAMSLVGDPQIVLLDEPTTGLDPLSRRRIWDMIMEIKQDRICVLTTHSMEEADALGDLIAIMASGRMRAFGTSLYLKNQFGSGYQVNLISSPDAVPRLESMVSDLLPGAEVVGKNAGNLTVGMPDQALKRLPAFFERLEAEKGLVREWGISHTTLEEVFLRLVQQGQLNQGGIGQHAGHATAGTLCALCHRRVPEQVAVATAGGSVLCMPHLVCMPCALKFPPPGAPGAPDGVDGQLRGVDGGMYAAIVRSANDQAATGSLLVSAEAAAEMLGGEAGGESVPLQDVATLAGQLRGVEAQAAARARVLVYARAQTMQLARAQEDATGLGQLNGQPLLLTAERQGALAQAQTQAQAVGKGVMQDHEAAVELLKRAVAEAERLREEEGNEAEARQDAEARARAEAEVAGAEQRAQARLESEAKRREEEAAKSSGASGASSETGAAPGTAQHQHQQRQQGAQGSGLMGPPQLGYRMATKGVPFGAQARALFIKNITLQMKQRRSNCCACCCTIVWLLVLYLANVGQSFLSSDTVCPDGLYYQQKSNLPGCGPKGFAKFFELVIENNDYTSWDSDYCERYMEGDPIKCTPNTAWNQLQTTMYSGMVQSDVRVWYQNGKGSPMSSLDLLGMGPGVMNGSDIEFVDKTALPSAVDATVLANQRKVEGRFEDIHNNVCVDQWQVYSLRGIGYLDKNGPEDARRLYNGWFPDAALEMSEVDVDAARGRASLGFTLWSYSDGTNDWYPYGAVQIYANSELGQCVTIYPAYDATNSPAVAVNMFTNGVLRAMVEAGRVRSANHSSPPLIRGAFVPMPVLHEYSAVPSDALGIQLLVLPLLGSFMVPSLLSFLAEEKQTGLFFTMRMQGLGLGAYWAGTYLFCITVLLVLDTVLVGFGYLVGLVTFTHVHLGVAALFFFCFSHAMVGFVALGSGLLGSSRTVSVLAYLFVFLQSLVIFLLTSVIQSASWPAWLNWIPQLGWGRAMYLTFGRGAESFADLRDEAIDAMVLVVVVGTLLLLLGMYLHAVVPAEHGQAKSPGFVLDPCRRRKEGGRARPLLGGSRGSSRSSVRGLAGEAVGVSLAPAHRGEGGRVLRAPLIASAGEEVSDDEEAVVVDEDVAAERTRVSGQVAGEETSAILIRGLRKVYKGGKKQAEKVAVRRLHLGIDYGECFGLLGPNGAGKTTTLSVLSGFQRGTSGSAAIAGYDVDLEMDRIHCVLGMCPQFDTVWPDLTVAEHLLFYARLKGASTLEERAVVQQVARRVQLDGDAFREPASALSGGMRRRLSLAISLIGNPSVLFLDEPSTGLDPETRRQIWDIVQREKEVGRAIVITTHSMEEADTLCSRIGIMSHGELRCIGSQVHLKNRFGRGYRLTLNMSSADAPVEDFVRRYVAPDARLESRVGTTALFVLPRESVNISKLFQLMDARKEEAGIVEWGISQTSLEEVFIRIATEAEGKGGTVAVAEGAAGAAK